MKSNVLIPSLVCALASALRSFAANITLMRTHIAFLLLTTAVSVHAAPSEATQAKLRALAMLPTVSVGVSLSTHDVEFPEAAFDRAELLRQASALRKELTQGPGDAERYRQIGLCLDAAGQSEEATEAWLKAAEGFEVRAKARPKDGPLQVRYAGALASIQRTNEAERVLRAAVKAAPEDWTCWAGLGKFVTGKSYLPLLAHSTNAISLRQILAGQPPPNTVLNQPLTPEEMKQIEEAQAEADRCFARAAELAPREPAAALAQALHQSLVSQRPIFKRMAMQQVSTPEQQLEGMSASEVCAAWAKVARLNPTNPAVIGYWGFVESLPAMLVPGMQTNLLNRLPEDRQKNALEALRLLDRLAQDPNPRVAAGALETLGTLRLLNFRDAEAALSAFRQATALDPTRVKAWDGLTMSTCLEEKWEEMAAVCQERLKHDDNSRNRVVLAKACFKANRLAEALKQAQTAVNLDDNNPYAHLCAGALLLRESRDIKGEAEMKQHFSKAQELINATADAGERTRLDITLGVNFAIMMALEGQFEAARLTLGGFARLAAGDQETIEHIRAIEALVLPAQPSPADRVALAELRARAEKGDARAQSKLGEVFLFGKLGATINEAEAVKWFRKAAEQNEVAAQYNLGCCYAEGRGVATNYVKALKWFRKAAEQNYAPAQRNLGVCYLFGAGVATNYVEAVKWLGRAATQNMARAQALLGNCYARGEGVATNHVEAVKWARKAAEQGDALGQTLVGQAYSSGLGVAKNQTEAVKWLRKAAEQNDAQAQALLGNCYARGEGVATNHVEAVKWARKAAEQGDALGQTLVGQAYSSGLGVAKNQTEAVKWLRKAAEQNDAQAQALLGNCYARGEGVATNHVEAAKWARKAAEQGDALGQNLLGQCYASGLGMAKDDVEGMKWIRKAAEQNDAQAQYILGQAYRAGVGVAKDDVEGMKWIRKAAEQDYAEAQCLVGLRHLGVAKGGTTNYAEAVKWLRKAALQNHAIAQSALGYCYERGQGVSRNLAEAVDWMRKAAEQDYAEAQLFLGASYLVGRSVPKDAAESYKWFLLVARRDEKGKATHSWVESKLSAEEKAEGKRRADEWLARRKGAARADR